MLTSRSRAEHSGEQLVSEWLAIGRGPQFVDVVRRSGRATRKAPDEEVPSV